MKEGWKYKKLGEVTTFQNGFAFKSSLFRKDGLPIVRISSFQDEIIKEDDLVSFYPSDYDVNFDNYKILPNDILIAMSGGTTGKLGINRSTKVFYQNQRVGVIRENKKVLNHLFLYYFLHTKSEESLKIAAGAAQPNLSTAQIKAFVIPLPSLEEQQSIVEYLDAAFAKIDAMKANAEKALNEAKALFQPSLKEMLEPKEGWEEKILQTICSDIVDCPHTTPQKVGFPTQYPCIRTSELKGGSIDWSTMQYLDEDEYRKRVSRLVPKPNDLVYGREGTYGDAVLLPDGYNFSLGQRTMLLRPNEIYIIPRFLLYSMISPNVYQQAKAKNNGCGVGHVNVKDIKVFRIGLPTIDIQQSIVSTLDSLKSKVDRLQANFNKISQECDALKQAILRQVFE